MIPGFSKDLKVSSLHVGARSSAAATSRSNARRVARLGSSFSGRSGLNSPKANSPSPTVQRAEAAAGSGEHPAAAAVVVVAVSATAAAPAGAASTNASAAAAADPVPAVADLAPAATAAASTAEALELFTALLSSLFFGLFGSGSIMVVYEVSGDYNKALGAAVFVSFVLGFCILSLEVPTKKLEVFVDTWATSKLKFFLGLVLSSTMTAMFCVVIFNLKMWNFGNGAYPLAVGVGLANLVSRP